MKRLSISVERDSSGVLIHANLGESKFKPTRISDPDSPEMMAEVDRLAVFLAEGGVRPSDIQEICEKIAADIASDDAAGTLVSVGLTRSGVEIRCKSNRGEFQYPLLEEKDIPAAMEALRDWVTANIGSRQSRASIISSAEMACKSGIEKFWELAGKGEIPKAEAAPTAEPEQDIPPYKKRVIDEFWALDKKLEFLNRFIAGNPEFKNLGEQDKELMLAQAEAMDDYRSILYKRLERWGLAPQTPEAALPIAETQKPATPQEDRDDTIRCLKTMRQYLDSGLQALKDLKSGILAGPAIDSKDGYKDGGEVVANVQLSTRHVEDAIMRLGMALKNVGSDNPYPNSYNPDSSAIEPTADGLKL